MYGVGESSSAASWCNRSRRPPRLSTRSCHVWFCCEGRARRSARRTCERVWCGWRWDCSCGGGGECARASVVQLVGVKCTPSKLSQFGR
eukprot:1635634-Prymnesium_polylepis.1